MELFIVEDGRATPSPQALLIPEFKAIMEQNEYEIAVIKFTYVECMCSYKKTNLFIGYPQDERGIKILATFPNISSYNGEGEEIVDELCNGFDVESLLEQREKRFVLAKQKLQNMGSVGVVVSLLAYCAVDPGSFPAKITSRMRTCGCRLNGSHKKPCGWGYNPRTKDPCTEYSPSGKQKTLASLKEIVDDQTPYNPKTIEDSWLGNNTPRQKLPRGPPVLPAK